MKRFLIVLSAVIMILGTVGMANAVLIGGSSWSYDFDSTAFVDSVIDSSGGWYWSGGTEAGLLNGNVNDGGIALYDGDYMSFAFIDNSVYNGAGADLAIFEAGFPAEDFIVSVSFLTNNTGWTSPIQYSTVYTGGSASGYNLNVVALDLSDFGIGSNMAISAVRIDGITHPTLGGTDLVAIGGMNISPVPEPATLILLGSGLAGLAFFRKKMKK